MIQLSIFDPKPHGAARRCDPETSVEAAKSVDVNPIEQEVLKALFICKRGLTVEELSEELGMSLVSISPRMRPLVNKGKVVDSGSKRKNKSGSNAIVWRIA